VLLTKPVGRSELFQRTTEPGTKFVPFTVSANTCPAPAVRLEGARDVIVGTGLEEGKIVNIRAFDVPPPGAEVNTVTLAVPGLAMSPARMLARRVPEST
jgi:hypothetical protein